MASINWLAGLDSNMGSVRLHQKKYKAGPRAAFLGRDRLEADSKILQSDDKGC